MALFRTDRKWIIPALLCLLMADLAMGQSAAMLTDIKERFPDESAVFIERSRTLNLVLDGDSLRAFTDTYEDLLHLKHQTEMYASRRVYGSSFLSVERLRAKTLVREKNKYREVPVTALTRNAQPADHVFYDDTFYYTFNYPSVAADNRTQLEYRQTYKDVRLISGFFFTTYAPQASSKFVIKAPKDVDLVFQVLNDPEKKIRFSRREKGGSVTYEWSAENLPGIRVEEESPDIRHYEPHLVYYVRSYKTKDKTVSVLPDLKALHTWYRSFLRHADAPKDPELVKVVNEIKQQHTSETDIVKNIFSWVQDNINYIAFEDGMRGFVPHAASYTFEKRYGDCKDMAILLVGMLEIAGIKAYPTWVGTRDIPYRYSEFPTPYVDDHMIATYISAEGQYFYLDATDQHVPFGFPSSMIQGKEAFISMDDDRFEVKEVPVIAADRSLFCDSLSIAIIDNQLTGKGSVSLFGYNKSATGHKFASVEEKSIRDLVVRIAGKGSNKFYLTDYAISNEKSKELPTRIDYEFSIGDYFQQLGDEIYINLNLSKDNYNRSINPGTRYTPHHFEFKYTKAEVIKFTIPDGFKVEHLPPNESFQGELLGYSVSYEVSENVILFKKQYYIDYLLLMPSKFDVWNEEVNRLSNAYRETVILKKT